MSHYICAHSEHLQESRLVTIPETKMIIQAVTKSIKFFLSTQNSLVAVST